MDGSDVDVVLAADTYAPRFGVQTGAVAVVPFRYSA